VSDISNIYVIAAVTIHLARLNKVIDVEIANVPFWFVPFHPKQTRLTLRRQPLADWNWRWPRREIGIAHRALLIITFDWRRFGYSICFHVSPSASQSAV
jgi:hypothetical protein